MACYSGPEIVNNGLVLHLDAANSRSYPGSGTTWKDISPKSHTANLVNGVSHKADKKGAMAFDGIDDYIQIPFSASTMDFSLAQTIIMWLKPGPNSNSTRRNPYNQAYGGPGTITHEPSGVFNYYFGTHGGNNSPYVGRTSSFTVVPNELAFISVTRSQPLDSCVWYKNGTRTNSSSAGGYATTNNGSSPILIGTGYTTRFQGDIFYVAVYNRFFSDTEIQQIYEATRSRYGI